MVCTVQFWSWEGASNSISCPWQPRGLITNSNESKKFFGVKDKTGTNTETPGVWVEMNEYHHHHHHHPLLRARWQGGWTVGWHRKAQWSFWTTSPSSSLSPSSSWSYWSQSLFLKKLPLTPFLQYCVRRENTYVRSMCHQSTLQRNDQRPEENFSRVLGTFQFFSDAHFFLAKVIPYIKRAQ